VAWDAGDCMETHTAGVFIMYFGRTRSGDASRVGYASQRVLRRRGVYTVRMVDHLIYYGKFDDSSYIRSQAQSNSTSSLEVATH
jgi:hypothetical protein